VKRREELSVFSLSFLDAICCGFGAIVLLLVLTKVGEPRAIETAREDLDGLVARLEAELHEIRGETLVLERELRTREEQVSEERAAVARLRGDLEEIQGEFTAAQQELTEEMRRLQDRQYRRPPDDTIVGGIPVDSEYVIFIIDTSGSMVNYAWPTVNRKMSEVLDAYPKIKGLQVMNDMGQYMYSHYAGKWIPDTPGRRRAVKERLASWTAFSNSSPVEGITAAIRAFGRGGNRVSLYVFGDEFSGSSIDQVVRSIDRINPPSSSGERPVRIHAIGFPTVFSVAGAPDSTGIKFATLMRILCRRNGGTFVGLSTLD